MARYVVQDCGSREDFDASDDAAALEHGEQWLRTGDWDRTKTLWLEAAVFRMDDHGEAERVGFARVTLPPDAPACSAASHAWCSPYELLGGLKESPGVVGHGGGVRITEVCRHCGVRRITDTWATNPCDGTQGYECVEYHAAGEGELTWVANQQEEA